MGTTADSEEVVLVDDSPDSCVTTGVPPLPELPALDLGVSAEFVPRLLVVCELLASFASALKLKRKLNVGELQPTVGYEYTHLVVEDSAGAWSLGSFAVYTIM